MLITFLKIVSKRRRKKKFHGNVDFLYMEVLVGGGILEAPLYKLGQMDLANEKRTNANLVRDIRGDTTGS